MTRTNTTNPKVDAFFLGASRWKQEFEHLREIILDCPLTEELKWGWPCYSFEGSNIVLVHGFKEYCAILFTQGALLKDSEGILIRQTENVQAARQIRFTDVRGIDEKATIIKAYINEAIEAKKAGLEVPMKKTSEFPMPEEFRMKLQASRQLKVAFEALTPGRQRGYLLHFSQAKQSKTRLARIEKCAPQILKGKGLND